MGGNKKFKNNLLTHRTKNMSDSEKEEQPVAKKRGRPSTVSFCSLYHFHQKERIDF